MRLGIIARADLTGLGNQSRNWVRLLNPSKVIVIDSSPFNHNEQHLEWYDSFDTTVINGFIQDAQIDSVLDDIDVLLTFEIPYNYKLFSRAKARGVKTILQNNWEFTDYLQNKALPLPDLLVNHSYWNLDKQKKLWPEIADYCATPVFVEDYEDIYHENLNRIGKRRFLHVAGRKTHLDRNGTDDLLQAVKLIPPEIDFELVVKTQTAEISKTDDSRVVIDSDAPTDEKELFRGFDAMLFPRRYAGASLPLSEALTSGLPTVMTDISPNNIVLPSSWLVPAERKTSFIARALIDVYSADHSALASKIAQIVAMDGAALRTAKVEARAVAEREYSSEHIMNKWLSLLHKLNT